MCIYQWLIALGVIVDGGVTAGGGHRVDVVNIFWSIRFTLFYSFKLM